MYAARENQLECAKELLGEVRMQDHHGSTALMVAVEKKH